MKKKNKYLNFWCMSDTNVNIYEKYVHLKKYFCYKTEVKDCLHEETSLLIRKTYLYQTI